MTDYISREAIRRSLCEDCGCTADECAQMLENFENGVEDCPDILWAMSLPSADVQPVRHGRWVVKGQDIYCSECNAESAYNPFGASKFSIYCPNCGAKLDLGGT